MYQPWKPRRKEALTVRNRQAHSLKGSKRRLNDAHFELVDDPRRQASVGHSMKSVLHTVVVSLMSGLTSSRACEVVTAGLGRAARKAFGIRERIADNTISRVLRMVATVQLVWALVRQVKAEHRRGNLKPEVVAMGVVAIDGKNAGTVHWKDLKRMCKVEGDGPEAIEAIRKVLAEKYPYAQLHVPKKGKPYAVVRVLNATLISSEAAVCIYTRPIEAETNEIGALPEALKELHAAYWNTSLFTTVTTDAGNTSLETTRQIRSYRWHFFCGIKANNGEIYAEGLRQLGYLGTAKAQASYSDKQNGKVVTYWVWVWDLGCEGYLDWDHARQVVRVRRVTEDLATGKRTVGNRYYVTSLSPQQLPPSQALKLSRAHWRIENNTHWTADTLLGQDRRRLALTTDPNGIVAVWVLAAIALNVLAVLRCLSRVGHTGRRPSWKEAIAYILTLVLRVRLDVTAFDAV